MKKRVLLICMHNIYHPDGGSLYTYLLANILIKNNYDVDICYFIKDEKSVREKIPVNYLSSPKRKATQFENIFFFQKIKIFIINDRKNIIFLNKISKDSNYDLIINSSRYFSKLNNGINFYQVQHNDIRTYNFHQYNFLKSQIIKIISLTIGNRNVLKNSKNIILFDEYNQVKTKNNIHYIKLASNFYEDINISNKERNGILFIGRSNSFQKNFNLLVDVMFKKQNINFGVVGEKPNIDNIPNNCKIYGIMSNKNVKEVMKNYKYLIILSRYEGFPFVVVDSLSMGIPCIILDTFSSAKELTSYYPELLIKYISLDDISNRIENLYYNSDYKNICFKAKEYAKHNLSMEEFNNKWKLIINKK